MLLVAQSGSRTGDDEVARALLFGVQASVGKDQPTDTLVNVVMALVEREQPAPEGLVAT